ncbi:MAG: beta-lactamase family protein [Alphaproteobacteria bacterium]|nr:beta-lactamase family protein [Alphaproteobacteria bacterium]
MEAVTALLDDLVTRRVVPSISLTVRVAGREVLHHTTGLARYAPPRPAVDDQPYDLASVTKVLAGTAVVASLVEDGTLALDTPAAAHLDGVDPRVTVRHLLQHGSGLPAWRKFYLEIGGRPFGTEATRAHLYDLIRSVPLEADPDTRHVYSDVGFLWLLMICEAATGTPFAQLFHQRVTVPSGVTDLRWGWAGAAATEWPCPYRHVGVEGTVHDLNCASLGGVSTHAGLFGTSRAVARIGEAFVEATRGNPDYAGLPGETLRTFWSLKGPGSHRCGWDGITRGGYTSTGRFFPDDAIGHLGYTGTSIWMSPERRTVVALLTNRAHPIDDPAPIRRVRPLVHDAVATALGWEAP